MIERRRQLLAAACCVVVVVLPGGLLGIVAGCASTAVTANPEAHGFKSVCFPPPPTSPRVIHLRSFNSLSDLVPRRFSFVELVRGRPIGAHVGTPAGIAFHDGHLYICDTSINAVHDWDLSSGEARRIGLSGDGVLAKPVAVAVDEGATLYVADTVLAEVVAFDATGRLTARYAPPDRKQYKPVAVAVRSSQLFVADIAAHRVDVFSAAESVASPLVGDASSQRRHPQGVALPRRGEHLASFGRPGSELGEFYFPMGLAMDPDGSFLVSDMMNGRLQRFDSGHTAIAALGRLGDRYGDMGRPRHLAVGPDGVIFIADTQFAHIHLVNRQGQLLMLMGGPEDQPGGTPMPVGVAVAPTLPQKLASLVPTGFEASYFLFTANTIGTKRISLFAVGSTR
ncbi:MAG: hypothetical protein V3W34_09705 [Phycisphaerae bacterium]